MFYRKKAGIIRLLMTMTLATFFLYGDIGVDSSLWDFCRQIQCATGSFNCLRYNGYGCYCGLGGGDQAPVDQIDNCCLAHDLCYETSRLVLNCSRTKTESYSFTCQQGTPFCSYDRNTRCESIVCQCDKDAAECFKRFIFPNWAPTCHTNRRRSKRALLLKQLRSSNNRRTHRFK